MENCFSLELFFIFSFKIDCITLDPDPDKNLDPDPNTMYLDPQHWLKCFFFPGMNLFKDIIALL